MRRGSVTGLAMHPSEDLAVTTGDEGAFRLWSRAAAPERRGAPAGAAGAAPAVKGHWLCRSVGSYRGALMQKTKTCVCYVPVSSLLLCSACTSCALAFIQNGWATLLSFHNFKSTPGLNMLRSHSCIETLSDKFACMGAADAPMTAAAFSADGSLVAVAAGDTVRRTGHCVASVASQRGSL